MRSLIVSAVVVVAACGPAAGPAPTAPTRAPASQPAVVAPSAPAPGKPAKAPAAATAPALVAPDVPGGAAAERDAHFARLVPPILEAFNNWDPYLTPDGREVVFTSDRDGLPQVYISDARAPQAPARRLVVTTERAWTPTPTPDGRHVVFRSDRGGDENWSFFRVDRDGRNLIELTPGELRRRDRPRMRGRYDRKLWIEG